MSDKDNRSELEALHFKVVSQFAAEIMSLNSESDVLWHLTHNVVSQLGFEDVVVYIFDEDQQLLVQSAAFGGKCQEDYQVLNPIQLRLGQGIVGRAALSRTVLRVNDTRTCDDYVVDDQQRLSELAVPLLDDGTLVGVIDSEHSELHYFTDNHVRTLTAIASIAATKISQNRALRQLQETVNKLEYSSKIQDALFEIAELIFETDNVSEFYTQLHKKISSLTFAKNFFIALSSSDGKSFSIPYCVDEVDEVPDNETTMLIDDPPSITGYVLQTNKPLLVYKEGIRQLLEEEKIYVKGSLPQAWLGVPFGNDALRGIVVVQSYNSQFVFNEKDKLLLSFVARHIRNAIERMQARSELTHLALHDQLTQLPNRILFSDRLDRALISLERQKQSLVALLFLDLDKFKFINDKYGHYIGDKLLKACAERLEMCVRESDTVCRIGGDEFAILLENLDCEQNIDDIANEIVGAISEPFNIEGSPLNMSISIGVSVCDKKKTPEKMFLEADEAMYKAKENGRNQVCFYQNKSGGDEFESFDLESEFKEALSQDQLKLEFQPIIDMHSERIVAGESLIRWHHPKVGLIVPNSFLPELERGQQIIALDEYVVSAAIQKLKAWRNSLPQPFSHLSVNVSGKGFNSESLLNIITSAFHSDPQVLKLLCLELTERSIVSSVEKTRKTMKKIRAMGVKVALDDFGTGYSSLSYLHQFHFDDLKIDKSFVSTYQSDSGKDVILEAIVNLANSLGIQTTAEGIETAEQFALMKKLGCKSGQGFYMSKPVSETVFHGLLCEGTPLSVSQSE